MMRRASTPAWVKRLVFLAALHSFMVLPYPALAWEDPYLALARQLLEDGLERSSFDVYADVARRSQKPALKADCLEMMAAISFQLGQPRSARTLLDRAEAWRAKALLAEEAQSPKTSTKRTGPVIRVLLARGKSLRLELPTPCKGANGRTRIPKGVAVLSASGGSIRLPGGSSGASFSCRPVGGVFRFGEKDYAGEVHLAADGKRVALVNAVPLETYLRGVVPAEMPASWDVEALVAQAVAARTYALYRLGTPRNGLFDMYDDERDQVYTGLNRRTPATDNAVATTHGQVLTHQGAPILAMYHAHSGGALECALDKGHPYLRGGSDTHSLARWDGDWERRIHAGQLRQALGHLVQEVEAQKKTPGGRLVSVYLRTEKGSRVVTLRELKKFLAPQRLPSSLCSAQLEDGHLVLTGKGWGHGLGMSQWGARALAEGGSSMREILSHYYPGAELTNTYP